MLRRFRLVAAIAVVVLAAANAGRAADGLQLRVLSSRPDMVSGGDALVRVELPAGVMPSDVKLTVNGTDATARFKADVSGRSLTGLVAGLTNGANTLTATAAKKSSAKLTVGNHPITGPLFSGPQEQPFVCMTNQFKLQGGGTLGPPLDANCSIATRIDTVEIAHPRSGAPMKVRIETGTINRGIYQIAMVEGAWNGRLIYTFGGGC